MFKYQQRILQDENFKNTLTDNEHKLLARSAAGESVFDLTECFGEFGLECRGIWWSSRTRIVFCYAVNDVLHRTDGPATTDIAYLRSGRVIRSERYYYDGVYVPLHDRHLFTGTPEDMIILRMKYGR